MEKSGFSFGDFFCIFFGWIWGCKRKIHKHITVHEGEEKIFSFPYALFFTPEGEALFITGNFTTGYDIYFYDGPEVIISNIDIISVDVLKEKLIIKGTSVGKAEIVLNFEKTKFILHITVKKPVEDDPIVSIHIVEA